MYHLLIVVFTIHALDYLFILPGDLKLVHHIAIYSVTFALTFIVSAISFEYFEKRFMKLKKKFTLIESGS
jgi:peptidoglycan/LPS O-acetylase OafA/YrhL